MVRHITLTQGQVALVDDVDFDRLSQLTWWALWNKNSKTYYAITGWWDAQLKRDIHQSMHRLIMEVRDPQDHVDHEDHNGLNNQRDNLRVCSPMENNRNRRKIHNTTSIYKGVSRNRGRVNWRACIYVNRRGIYLGMFANEEQAALAYNVAAKQHFGSFAILNNVKGSTE